TMTVDNLPEFTVYRDEGCEAAPSCLNCPFPRCLEEEPRGRQKAATAARARDMAAMHRRGLSTMEIARACGRSRRTVQRLLKLARDGGPEVPASPPDASPGSSMTRQAGVTPEGTGCPKSPGVKAPPGTPAGPVRLPAGNVEAGAIDD
ncbi:MAG: helix-turn-helix domain-containing protein, partial [Dehalococcoidia bacterium]|nr:helix-turn-helix domain-containing protein [Dehalococcoidia bacterium]